MSPQSTYRLQFHKDFTFRDQWTARESLAEFVIADGLVPHELAGLGVKRDHVNV